MKNWYQSKTIWHAIIRFIIFILVLVGFASQAELLSDHIEYLAMSIVGIVDIIVTVIIRLKTRPNIY